MAPTRQRTRLHSKLTPCCASVASKAWYEKEMVQWGHACCFKHRISIKRTTLDHHQVPRTTLSDRHLGIVVPGTRPGPQSYLSQKKESELGTLIQVVGELGYGRLENKSRTIHLFSRKWMLWVLENIIMKMSIKVQGLNECSVVVGTGYMKSASTPLLMVLCSLIGTYL